MNKPGLLTHYKNLIFFSLKRFEGDNYQRMREYFAEVLISEIEDFISLKKDKKILDVGGAKGEFCEVINRHSGCEAINFDPEPGSFVWENTIKGYADDLPFGDNEFDLVVCRGTLEHIPADKQQRSVDEMYRVLKPSGICYIMIPPWYNPHAGHSLKPFHYLPFKAAKFLRELFFRKKVDADSYADAHLYPITFAKIVRLIKAGGFKILAAKDTHFKIHFLTHVPVLREILIPSVAFILSKEKNT